jgi:hypothetical protein
MCMGVCVCVLYCKPVQNTMGSDYPGFTVYNSIHF